ncbi:MAG TPA: sigma-70 family RNA polymerase sigma factor [Solirubrobacterales bacterium]|nr:sigma-70 family RNA polymerase sigma factor [Solirubrobacterales bacterium]
MAAGLSPERERLLAIATEAGDRGACRELVEGLMPAIVVVARRFPVDAGVSRQELTQEGVAGLLLACRRYDPRLGTPFWAYATFWVRKAMQELVAEMTRPVALSDRAARELAVLRNARREYLQVHGVEATATQLAAATELAIAQVESLLAAERRPRGIEERERSGDDGAPTVGESIRDPSAETAYDAVLDEIEFGAVNSMADGLEERERTVIRAHYGIGEPARTLREIGGALGLSAERARQIEVGALRTMRERLARSAGLPDGWS